MVDGHGYADTLEALFHADRASRWKEHLVEVENMLPYLVDGGYYKYVS